MMSMIYAHSTKPFEVANCDYCGNRPGTHTVIAYGIETWVCDVCSGREEEPEEEVISWFEDSARIR